MVTFPTLAALEELRFLAEADSALSVDDTKQRLLELDTTERALLGRRAQYGARQLLRRHLARDPQLFAEVVLHLDVEASSPAPQWSVN